MFQSDAHRMAGHAAAAKSSKTPPHLRAHQARLAGTKATVSPAQTAALGPPKAAVPFMPARAFPKPAPAEPVMTKAGMRASMNSKPLKKKPNFSSPIYGGM